MISKKKIKQIAGRYGKKIGKEAILELEKKIIYEIERLVQKGVRNANFRGRSTIVKEDFDDGD
ncbi:MAG: hypothetical protein AABX66_01155 [Nanoarchaeota archaeon]